MVQIEQPSPARAKTPSRIMAHSKPEVDGKQHEPILDHSLLSSHPPRDKYFTAHDSSATKRELETSELAANGPPAFKRMRTFTAGGLQLEQYGSLDKRPIVIDTSSKKKVCQRLKASSLKNAAMVSATVPILQHGKQLFSGLSTTAVLGLSEPFAHKDETVLDAPNTDLNEKMLLKGALPSPSNEPKLDSGIHLSTLSQRIEDLSLYYLISLDSLRKGPYSFDQCAQIACANLVCTQAELEAVEGLRDETSVYLAGVYGLAPSSINDLKEFPIQKLQELLPDAVQRHHQSLVDVEVLRLEGDFSTPICP